MRNVVVYVKRLLAITLIITAGLSQPAAAATELPGSFADLAEKLLPAVVNISTTQKVNSAKNMPALPFRDMPQGPGLDEFREFFERFGQPYGDGSDREIFSLGSGFIIDPAGYVVTNRHVIDDSEEITVILSDNSKYKAKIIGKDAKTDLALLKIDAGKTLPFVSFGNSDAVRVGDWAIAIGNPFGLGGTVTAGIISARARNINAGPFDDFLQTDAAINRGNSGGPLFNTKGEVIGIATAIFSPSGGNIGIGFAVPTSLAQPVIQQLREYGRTHRGWLGVKIQEVTEEVAEGNGLKTTSGALVIDVTKGSPADKAGIKTGDIILSFDGKEIKEMRFLPRLVAETKIGRKVEMGVWRSNKRQSYTVELGELQEDDIASAEQGAGEKSELDTAQSEEILGMRLSPLSSTLREQLGVDGETHGLVVTDVKVDGPAGKRDLRYGDVIMQINDKAVDSVDELKDALGSAKKAGRKFAMVRVMRAGEVVFTTLPTDLK